MIIAAVLFDIDDTLFDYGGAERAGILAHLDAEDAAGAFPSPDAAVARWREVMNAQYQRFLVGELTFEGQRLARARAFAAELDPGAPPLDDAAAAAWFARYHEHVRAHWRAFPDADPVLRELAAARVPIGIVSNSTTAFQREKLDRIGLGAHFADTPFVCSAEHGAPKPDPSIFRAGCAGLGLDPGAVAYVGDKRDIDAEAAAAAGLHGVWLNRAGSANGTGVPAIASLAEVPALVGA